MRRLSLFLLLFASAYAHAMPLPSSDPVVDISFAPSSYDAAATFTMTVKPLVVAERSIAFASSASPVQDWNLRGFELIDSYRAPDGSEYVLRLRPVSDATASAPHGAGPFAIALRMDGIPTTRLIPFIGPAPASSELPSAEPNATLAPVSIPYSPAEVAWIVAEVLLAIAVLVAIAFGVRAALRVRALRRLAPRERAFRELSALLQRDLPARGRYKDFYVELTHVVRRYIERRYHIRAPRQTTEEFLHEARTNAAFTQDTVALLARFLESADRVKFAGERATAERAADAAASARSYLEAEREEQRAESGERS